MMKAVVSVHDVSPVFLSDISAIIKRLPNTKKSFLLTPQWNGDGIMNRDLSDMLMKEDVILHGLTHRSERFDPFVALAFLNRHLSREFRSLSAEESRRKIELGVKLFEDCMGRRPEGFIPPMWYHNRYTIEILKNSGFLFTETWTSFINFRKNETLRSLPISSDYGNNLIISRLVLSGWKAFLKNFDKRFIRLAIHPSDLKSGMMPKINDLIRILEDKQYTFLTYQELMAESVNRK